MGVDFKVFSIIRRYQIIDLCRGGLLGAIARSCQVILHSCSVVVLKTEWTLRKTYHVDHELEPVHGGENDGIVGEAKPEGHCNRHVNEEGHDEK